MSAERLRHSPKEVVIGLTESPAGTLCVGMTFQGRDWILFTTKRPIIADQLRKQLQDEFQVESLPGLPIDWRSSLASEEIKLIEDDSKFNKPVGVFIPAEAFDRLVTFNLITGT